MTTTCSTIPSVYSLARMAGCADPDGLATPGAVFLLAVAEHVEDRRDDGDDVHDLAAEVADASIPPYTHDLWSVFTDLALWQEDTTDLIGDDADMTRRAATAIYIVGERLAAALLEA